MLILASQSPRRRELLERAGIAFAARPVQVEERRAQGESARDYVRRLAEEKARAAPAGGSDVVLGADTVVVFEEHVLEKPADADDAARMLRMLAGQQHEVITGICLHGVPGTVTDLEVTLVRFSPLSDAEIDAYVASGEPMDKAGAYAIQGLASRFVERVDGCYANVVGLPVARVYRHLRRMGQL